MLAKRGYSLEAIEDGERIIATAIREPMVINADGSLGPLTPGSTRPTTMVVHHTGTVKTRRFTSPAPGKSLSRAWPGVADCVSDAELGRSVPLLRILRGPVLERLHHRFNRYVAG